MVKPPTQVYLAHDKVLVEVNALTPHLRSRECPDDQALRCRMPSATSTWRRRPGPADAIC